MDFSFFGDMATIFRTVLEVLGKMFLVQIMKMYISYEHKREIVIKLAERGVNTNINYKFLPMKSSYKAKGQDIKYFPNAYTYYQNLVTLPLHIKLSNKDVGYVIENYKEVVREYILM